MIIELKRLDNTVLTLGNTVPREPLFVINSEYRQQRIIGQVDLSSLAIIERISMKRGLQSNSQSRKGSFTS